MPFIQLDPMKTILVFSHEHNTFDKRKLLENPSPQFVKPTTKTVDMFIKNKDMKDFYMNRIVNYLKNYAPGRPNMKPDVLKQIEEINAKRQKDMENMQGKICIQGPDGKTQILDNNQVIKILQQQQQHIQNLQQQIKGKDMEIVMLTNTLNNLSQNTQIIGNSTEEHVNDIMLQINTEN